MNTPFPAPALIIIRGIPGSGKTSIAKALAETLGNVEHIDPDDVDVASEVYRDFSRSLTAQGVDEKFHTYRYLNAKARQGIDAGNTIIWNQAFIDFKGLLITIERLKEYADEQGVPLPVLVVDVVIDAAVARQRTETRAAQDGRIIDDDVMARFIRDYVPFDQPGYPSLTVQGTDPVATSVATIVDAL